MYELCGRTKPGGGKCQSPSLKGKSFCYYHDPRRLRRAKAVKVRYFLELTMLEPGGAVQAAISETVQALARNEIDTKHGGRLLYALQLASSGKSSGKKLGTSRSTNPRPATSRSPATQASQKSFAPRGSPPQASCPKPLAPGPGSRVPGPGSLVPGP
jgi:hypothetical protein